MKMLKLVVLLSLAILSGCAGGKAAARPASDFRVKLITGEEVALTASEGKPVELNIGAVVEGRFQEPHVVKGKPVVLNIGASWCPHCLHEMPNLKAAYEKYKDDVSMLVVFTKSPEADVLTLVKKNDLKFMVGFDPEAEVGKAYGVRGIPVTFFIDAQGRVVDDYFGGIEKDELFEKIENLLKTNPAHP